MIRTPVSLTSTFPSRPMAEMLERRTLLSVSLVQDINTGNVGSNPSSIFGTPSGVLFTASDGQPGSPQFAVWKTDGTAAGTGKLDNPPPHGLDLLSNSVSYKGAVYFITSEGQSGALWKTDGTSIGTVPVFENFSSGNTQIVTANGNMLFPEDQFGKFGLWVSNGTADGTRFLSVLPAPAPDQPLVVLGDKVFYVTQTASKEGQIWYTDGTDAGSGMLIGGLGTSQVLLTKAGGALYLYATNGPGHGLYKSDGTPSGTTLISPVSGATDYGNQLAVAGNTIVFTGYDSQYGTQLWSSDGTAGGTHLVRVIDAYDPKFQIDALQFSTFNVVNGQVVFFLTDPIRPDQTGLWRSDGTAINSYLLQPMVRERNANWPDLTMFGNAAYFRGEDGTHGPQLWKTDGIKASFLPINPSSFADPKNITVADGALYFSANDGQHGQELWTSDGTAAGTHLVKDLNLNPASSNPSNLLDANGTLFFAATDPHGVQVWSSDGTAAGTTRLTSLSPDETGDTYDSSYGIEQLTAGDGVYFVTPANDLWHVNAVGSASRIFQAPAGSPQMAISNLAVAGGQAFFIVGGTLGTLSFYRTNGTAAGTVKLAQWARGPLGIERMVSLGSQVIFDAISGDTPQVWHSDGTFSGTGALTDFQPQRGVQIDTADLLSASSVIGSTLYFVTNETTHVGTSANELTTRQLWKTDGTAAGTVMLDRRFTFQLGPTPDFFPFGGGVDFFATQGSVSGLWRISPDGTETQAVATASLPQDEAILNGKIYFSIGSALWQTDGTQAGTQLVKDIGTRGFGTISGLVATAGSLYFVGEDAAHGTEVWQSDGTPQGTTVASDIVPGFGSSNPQKLTVSGDRVFFTADDGTHGRELWSARPSVQLDFGYLLRLAQHYNQLGTFESGDLTGDGKVDFADLLMLSQNYGSELGLPKRRR